MFLSRQLALSVTSRRYLRGGQRRVVQQRARHLSFWRALDQSAQAEQDTLNLCSSQESVSAQMPLFWKAYISLKIQIVQIVGMRLTPEGREAGALRPVRPAKASFPGVLVGLVMEKKKRK